MNTALLRLLQLVSPTLPIGAYTYSQGLEWAVEIGVVNNEATALAWIGDCLRFGNARFEAVYFQHMLAAWQLADIPYLTELDSEFIASRETAELRAETLQMGYSLARLLVDIEPSSSSALLSFNEPSLPLAWSCAAAIWAIPEQTALTGYLWAWLENQVIAAVKVVPLGQTAGQRLLLALAAWLPQLAAEIAPTSLPRSRNYLPAFAIASSCHETQYSRLFRS